MRPSSARPHPTSAPLHRHPRTVPGWDFITPASAIAQKEKPDVPSPTARRVLQYNAPSDADPRKPRLFVRPGDPVRRRHRRDGRPSPLATNSRIASKRAAVSPASPGQLPSDKGSHANSTAAGLVAASLWAPFCPARARDGSGTIAGSAQVADSRAGDSASRLTNLHRYRRAAASYGLPAPDRRHGPRARTIA